MAYKVRCTSCGKSMRLPEGDAGRPVVCLACGTKFVAPPANAPQAPKSGAAAAGAVTKSVSPAEKAKSTARDAPPPLTALLDTGPMAEPKKLKVAPLPPPKGPS